MALTEKQWEKLYDLSITNGRDIKWIRENAIETADSIKNCNKRLGFVERDQAFIRGRMARFAGSIAVICAIAVNGILWVFNYFGGKQ